MARALLMAHPENATIEELKQVCRLGSNETATRCSAIQMLGRCLQKTCLQCSVGNQWHNRQPMYLPPYSPDLNPIERIWLTMKARWFNNHVCKTEKNY